MSREVAVSALSAMTYARGGPLGDTPLRPRLRSLNLTPSTISSDPWCFVMSRRCLMRPHVVLSSVSARWAGRGTSVNRSLPGGYIL